MASETQLLSPAVGRPRVRRLSSVTATLDELSLGPAIVVPPNHMHKPSDAHELAASMGVAKHRLNSISAGMHVPNLPSTPPESSVTDSYAFAFDIDGVLVRGGKPIPEAIEAMKVLNGDNQYGIKVWVEKPEFSRLHSLTVPDLIFLLRTEEERQKRRDV